MSGELAGPGEGAGELDPTKTDRINGPKLYHPDTDGYLSGLLPRERFLTMEKFHELIGKMLQSARIQP